MLYNLSYAEWQLLGSVLTYVLQLLVVIPLTFSFTMIKWLEQIWAIGCSWFKAPHG